MERRCSTRPRGSVGGRFDQELLAVPHQRPQGAVECRVGEGLQRGQGARLGEQHGPHTSEQTHIALFWQSNVLPTWNEVARNLAEDLRYAVDLADSALLFAMLNLSGADAGINCWNDKYYWDFWRPWQAIHEADRDGNPATEPDGSWTALLTAPYPEHPSGHLRLDGANLGVLRMFFGTDKVPFGVTSARFPGEIRSYDRFSDALDEIVEARIWAGLHYRTADVQARFPRQEGRPLHGEALPAARRPRRPPPRAVAMTTTTTGVATARPRCP